MRHYPVLVLLAVLLVACGTGPAADEVYLVVVHAEEGWQDTTITLRANQAFEVEYGWGEWTTWTGQVPLHGPEGTRYVCGDPETCCEPIAVVPSGTLIGRVGDDAFAIGNGGTFRAKSEGTLHLRINDCDSGLYDNSGSVTVKVRP